jgi:hypothetical protein
MTKSMDGKAQGTTLKPHSGYPKAECLLPLREDRPRLVVRRHHASID